MEEPEGLVQDLHSHGVGVVVLNMLVVDDYVALHPNGMRYYTRYLGELTDLARRRDVKFLDFQPEVSSLELFRDPTHLNSIGAARFSRVIGCRGRGHQMSTQWGEPGPTGPIASTARFFNHRLPRVYWLVTVVPRLVMGAMWIRRVARLGLGHPLSDLDFPDLKGSETLFVLATGASINRYKRSRWDIIERHDSIGMNFFMLHEFVPDLFVMERLDERHRRLLRMRSHAYRDVPIILKTQLTNLSPGRLQERLRKLEQNPPDVRNRFYLSLDLLVAGNDLPHTYSAYKLMKRAGLFKTKPRFLLLTKRRGSITYIINLAVRIGYKRIVLCGVDLNHNEYFFDSRRKELEARGLPVPPNPHDGAVHVTYDPRKHPVTVKDVIVAMNETVLEPLGVELYVGDRSSALHPHFPEYPWREA